MAKSNEINQAICSYLKAHNFQRTLNCFKEEMMNVETLSNNCTDEKLCSPNQPKENAFLSELEKRWSSIGKLQKKIIQLESTLKDRKSFIHSCFNEVSPSTYNKKSITDFSTLQEISQFPTSSIISSVVTNPTSPFMLCISKHGPSLLLNIRESLTCPHSTFLPVPVPVLGHTLPVTSASFAMHNEEDGKNEWLLTSGSADSTIKICSVGIGNVSQPILYAKHTILSHQGSISFLYFCSNSRVLSYSKQDGCLMLHSAKSAEQVGLKRLDFEIQCIVPDSFPHSIRFIAVSKENQFFMISVDGCLEIEPLLVNEGAKMHKSQVTHCIWAMKDILITAAKDRTIRIWQLKESTKTHSKLSISGKMPINESFLDGEVKNNKTFLEHVATIECTSGWICNISIYLETFLLCLTESNKVFVLDLAAVIKESKDNKHQLKALDVPWKSSTKNAIFIFPYLGFLIVAFSMGDIGMYSIE